MIEIKDGDYFEADDTRYLMKTYHESWRVTRCFLVDDWREFAGQFPNGTVVGFVLDLQGEEIVPVDGVVMNGEVVSHEQAIKIWGC